MYLEVEVLLFHHCHWQVWMNTDLKGEGEPCLNDSMLFTSSLILVNDSGSEMSNWFYIVGHIKLFLSM